MILLGSYVGRGHRITLEREGKWTQWHPRLEGKRQARGPRNQHHAPQAGFHNSVQDSYPTAREKEQASHVKRMNKHMHRCSITWDTISNSWKWQNLHISGRYSWRSREMGLLIHYSWKWEFHTIEQNTIYVESSLAICIRSIKGF